MKKQLICILITIAFITSLIPLASANQDISGLSDINDDPAPIYTGDIDMKVQYQAGGSSGSNQAPFIKAKFEVSEGIDTTYPTGYKNHEQPAGPYHLDDDETKAGTQVDPPLYYDGTTWIGYYVFVGDPDDLSEIAQVHVDVWHPDDDSPLNQLGQNLWYKYNIVLDEIPITQLFLDFLAAVETYEGDNPVSPIVCFGDTYNWEDLWFELLNGHLKVYYSHEVIHYCQPAGYYKVQANAVDIHSAAATPLNNYFEYVLGVGIETDFNYIDFGIADLNQWKWEHGDWIFDDNNINDQYTIRSIGNWDNHVTLEFDDFGMGQSNFGGAIQWNVIFDVRLGDTYGAKANRSFIEKMLFLNPTFTEYQAAIHPDTEVTLPNDWDPRNVNLPEGPTDNDIISNDYFAKCNTSKISFAIKIRKDIVAGTYGRTSGGTGDDNDLTIGISAPFEYAFLNYLPCGQEPTYT
jgi:hypothetical protein